MMIIYRRLTESFEKTPLLLPALISLLTSLSVYYYRNAFPLIILYLLLLSLTKRLKSDRILILSVSLIILLRSFSAFYQDDMFRDSIEPGETLAVDENGLISSKIFRLDGKTVYMIDTSFHGRILYYSDHDNAGTGDTIRLQGKISMPDRPSNPGEYNRYDDLVRKGLKGIYYPDDAGNMIIIRKNRNPLKWFRDASGRFLYGVRMSMMDLFGSEKELSAALFMGDTSLLEDGIRRDFKLSGCSHLLCVSGTHFSGFLLVLPWILHKNGKGKKLSILIYALFCIAVASFTGWSSSVTRAAFICFCSFSSRDFLSGMSLSSLMLSFADPFAPLSYGFQMSYLTAFAIRYLAFPISEAPVMGKLPDKLKRTIAASLTASVAMMPFLGITDMRYGLTDLLFRMMASFLASLSCALFIPSLLLMNVSLLEVIMKLIKYICHVSTGLSGGSVSGVRLGCFFTAVLFFTVILRLMPPSLIRKKLKMPSLLILSVLSGVFLVRIVFPPDMIIIFIDVGQGSSCLVLSHDTSILIDAGTYDKGDRAVSAVLDHYGVDKLDVAIMTHWDEDHAGGMVPLIENDRIGRLFTSYTKEGGNQKEFYGRYPQIKDKIELSVFQRGDKIILPSGLEIDCIYPESEDVSTGSNEDSAVMIIKSKDFSLLVPGDISSEEEYLLIRDGDLTDCDVLLCPHHGSSYSSSADFLQVIKPEYTVIQAGKNNIYGHPSQATLNRLTDAGSSIFETSRFGAVTFTVYPNDYYIDTNK